MIAQLSGVSKWYGKKNRVRALSGVSLGITAGLRLMVVGRSGSGKSTLAKCLANWEQPEEGRVEIFGGAKVQLIPQEPGASLNPHWTAAEVIAEPYRISGLSKVEAVERALTWMQRMELPLEAQHKLSAKFSGGEQARLAIARALAAMTMEANKSGLLICDESFSALDEELRIRLFELLVELAEEFRVTYILMSHDLALTSRYAKRIAVMSDGELIEEGDKEQMLTCPKSEVMRRLLSAALSNG